MKKYLITATRGKVVYEETELTIEAENEEEARYKADDELLDCSSLDGSHPVDMDWEENGDEEYNSDVSEPEIDSIVEI